MINQLIERVEAAIEKAKKEETKLEEFHFGIYGMSDKTNRILFNELVKPGDKYVEVGTHEGSTFVPALYDNQAFGVAIDNWSQFATWQTRNNLINNCSRIGNSTYQLVEQDCFALDDATKALIRGANVYFYDGLHSFATQEKGITYYMEYLAPQAIIIVDDWDYDHDGVAAGTRSGLEKTGIKVHKEWVLNKSTTGLRWWNGIFVAVVER